MALSEPPQTIDRDNSIAGASDASSSGFRLSDIVYTGRA